MKNKKWWLWLAVCILVGLGIRFPEFGVIALIAVVILGWGGIIGYWWIKKLLKHTNIGR